MMSREAFCRLKSGLHGMINASALGMSADYVMKDMVAFSKLNLDQVKMIKAGDYDGLVQSIEERDKT